VFTLDNLDKLLKEYIEINHDYVPGSLVISKNISNECKQYLGLPQNKPIDWYPAKLYLMVVQSNYSSQYNKTITTGVIPVNLCFGLPSENNQFENPEEGL